MGYQMKGKYFIANAFPGGEEAHGALETDSAAPAASLPNECRVASITGKSKHNAQAIKSLERGFWLTRAVLVACVFRVVLEGGGSRPL